MVLVKADREEAAWSRRHVRSLEDRERHPSFWDQGELKAEEKVPFDDPTLEHDFHLFPLVSVQADHLREGHCHDYLAEERREGEAELKSANSRKQERETFEDADPALPGACLRQCLVFR